MSLDRKLENSEYKVGTLNQNSSIASSNVEMTGTDSAVSQKIDEIFTYIQVDRNNIAYFSTLITPENVNSYDYWGIPLLHYVLRYTGPKYFDILLKNKVNLNIKTKPRDKMTECTALQWMLTHWMAHDAINHDSYFLKYINKHSCDDSYPDNPHEKTCIITQTLLENKAELDFFSACALGKVDFVQKHLLDDKDAAKSIGPDGSSALAWATRKNQHAVIKLLLENKADANHSNRGLTPFDEAVKIYDHEYPAIEEQRVITLDILFSAQNIERSSMLNYCRYLDTQKITYLMSKDKDKYIHPYNGKDLVSSPHAATIMPLFNKHKYTLNNVDKYMLKYESGLLFWAIENIEHHNSNSIKSLIYMGCNINIRKQYDKNSSLRNALLLQVLQFEIASFSPKDEKKLKNILHIMAVLFFNNAPLEMEADKPYRGLDSLKNEELIIFLRFFHAEFLIPDNKSPSYDNATHIILNKKIKEAILYLDSIPEEKTSSEHSASYLAMTSLREIFTPSSLKELCLFKIRELESATALKKISFLKGIKRDREDNDDFLGTQLTARQVIKEIIHQFNK